MLIKCTKLFIIGLFTPLDGKNHAMGAAVTKNAFFLKSCGICSTELRKCADTKFLNLRFSAPLPPVDAGGTIMSRVRANQTL
jgi:hypothetical protein